MAKSTGPEPHKNVEAHSKLFRDLLLGFVKIHVLHHASLEPIYGAGISAELETHGYRLSWGTLYPLLHSLVASGFLKREDRVVEGKVRKYYRITPLGRRALTEARRKALELVNEITESDDELVGSGSAGQNAGSQNAGSKNSGSKNSGKVNKSA